MKHDQHHIELNSVYLVFFVTLMVMLIGIGCATVSDVVEKTKDLASPVMPSKNDLKKKVGIAKFENISEIKDESLARQLESLLVENLGSKYEDIILVQSKDSDDLQFLADLPKNRSGEVNNLLLSEKGRKSGLNAIVAATIISFRRGEETSGFVWFKESNTVAKMIIRVDVYDTYTGAKAMFETYNREIKIGDDDLPVFDSGKIMEIESVAGEMAQVSKDMGKAIYKALEKEKWKGLIISADNDKVVLSAGAVAGIKTGDRFDIFDNKGTVEGIGGHQYHIPGLAIDEIEITSLNEDRSEGVSVSGNSIAPGSLVQEKEK